MPSPLAKKALPEILLCPPVLTISLIISVIPLCTPAAFTGFTTITTITTITTSATLLCKEQSFWSEPILFLDCSLRFNELGDDLTSRGGHRGVFVQPELQEDFPFVIPWDPAKKVQDVLLLTHLGDCLCTVHIGISVSSRWCCRCCAEIVISVVPINPQCVVVDIFAVLSLDAPKVFPNLEDVEL
jgi:hypothetical protein